MAKAKKAYGIPFRIYEEDAQTLAAIDRGLEDVKAGRVVGAEEVRKLMGQWIAAAARKRHKRIVTKE
jgi:predicted transcriptional regulator